MNKAAIVSSIISGIVGLAVGGGSVFLYYKKIQDNYNKELDETRALNKSLQDQLKVKSDDIKNELLGKFASKNEYEEAINSIPTESEEEEPKEVDESVIDTDPNETDVIRFIGPKDYEEDEDYEKEKIKFYAKDGVLTQDDEVLTLEEFQDICGKRALISFGRYGAGLNVCYVRNEEFMTDYEIKRYNMSYQSYKNSLK